MPEPTKTESPAAPAPPPDRSPAAKDAAIAKLREGLKENKELFLHFDTIYGMLRGDPAFDANDPDERIYIMNHWSALESEKTEIERR